MIVYLIRHGQSESNVIGRYNSPDENLTEVGIKQAMDLRDVVKNIDYDIIISSPLIRALRTAQIINVKNKEIITDDRLAERNHRSLIGKSFSITDRDEMWNYYSKTIYADEERVPKLCERIKEFLDELKTKNYSKVLIVSHSGVSKAFHVYFNGVPEDGKLLKLGLKNTEIKKYEL